MSIYLLLPPLITNKDLRLRNSPNISLSNFYIMQISPIFQFLKNEHDMKNSGESAHMIETTIEIKFKCNLLNNG